MAYLERPWPPFGQKILFCHRKKIRKHGLGFDPLCVSISDQRKFDPLYEIRNTPLNVKRILWRRTCQLNFVVELLIDVTFSTDPTTSTDASESLVFCLASLKFLSVKERVKATLASRSNIECLARLLSMIQKLVIPHLQHFEDAKFCDQILINILLICHKYLWPSNILAWSLESMGADGMNLD